MQSIINRKYHCNICNATFLESDIPEDEQKYAVITCPHCGADDDYGDDYMTEVRE